MNSVNDAFSVSLSPSSCVINADYNGANPKLTYAYSDIRVIRGDKAVVFDQPTILSKSNAATAEITKVDETTWRITILTIPTTDLNGNFQLQIKVGDEFLTTATFSYTVVRETSMLDWILDWNGTYTEITGKWVITPKIFAGTKNADGEITGVYMGPSFDNDESTGLYGYKDDEIIFQLTETGGMIGGWQINNGGIQTSDGYLKILSEGTIISAPNGEMAWKLYKNGSASFAGGKVNFYANGNADFEGSIKAKGGTIGGWFIGAHSIWNQNVLIDSTSKFIGLLRDASVYHSSEPSKANFYNLIQGYGGVAIFSESAAAYGIEGWVPTSTITENIGGNDMTGVTISGVKVFSLGSENLIAGWHFDENSLYIGTKNNTSRQNTNAAGHITIGSNGLRGRNWYIDDDGEISFVNGLLHFDENGGTISGWTLRADRLSNANMAMVSNTSFCGLYLSLASIADTANGSLGDVISAHGGLILKATQCGSSLQMWETDGTPTIYISSTPEDANYIGRWYFDSEAFYYGPKVTTANSYTSSGCITVSPYGLRGPKWRLEPTGAGAIAGGKISWEANGKLTLDNTVKISWSQVTGTEGVMTTATYIDANGIFTGQINASLIKTGTLDSSRINADELLSNGNKWALKQTGAGYLASKNIEWDADGNINVKGSFSQDIHYAYKCDATIASRSSYESVEDAVSLKLNHHLYIATNVLDDSDEDDYQNYLNSNNPWPYQLDPMHYYTIILPCDPQFIGKEVKIYDCNYGPFSRQPMRWCTTTIKVQNDVAFATKVNYDASFSKENLWKSITIRGGYASFVCIPTSHGGCSWICVDFYGALCKGVDANNTTHENLTV